MQQDQGPERKIALSTGGGDDGSPTEPGSPAATIAAGPAPIDDGSALLGRMIAGKFLLEAVLGVGGSGTVYRARQLELDRTVALKLLRRELARDAQLLARFKREARAASRLDHPNSVRVLDVGQDEDATPYLVMEHVQGRTLFEVIDREWPLDDARIVRLLSQVLAALAVAHDLGVIHRDLKPENIIILRTTGDDGEESEQAKVCDFGLAALGTSVRSKPVLRAEPRVTLSGTFAGTPEYMSPEQVRGELGDHRSDLYSLGVVLYHLLAAQVPFQDDNPWKVACRHTTDVPVPPSQLANCHPGLEAVCLKAISKRPEDRFASAREMRAALRACLGDPARATMTPAPLMRLPQTPISGVVVSSRRTAVTSQRHGHRWLLGTAGGLLALVLAARFVPRPTPPAPEGGRAEPAPIATAPLASTAAAAPGPAEPAAAPLIEGEPPAAPAEPHVTRARPTHRGGGGEPAMVASIPLAIEPPPLAVPAFPVEPPPPPTPRHRAVATAPPAAPPALRWDPQRASVAIVSISTTSAIPGANVRAALARVPLVECYREHGAPSPAPGTATLLLRLDVSGYVTAATLEGPELPPALRACVLGATRRVRVKDVDTGEASAAVTLRFSPS